MESKISLVSAEWCNKCTMVKNLIESKGLDVQYVDAEKSPDITTKYGIMSLPTIIDNREGKDDVYVGQGKCMELVSTL